MNNSGVSHCCSRRRGRLGTRGGGGGGDRAAAAHAPRAMGPCPCVQEPKLWPMSILTFGPISIFSIPFCLAYLIFCILRLCLLVCLGRFFVISVVCLFLNKNNILLFLFFENKNDAQRPYDHFGGGIAPRSLLCVRKQRFPFCEK